MKQEAETHKLRQQLSGTAEASKGQKTKYDQEIKDVQSKYDECMEAKQELEVSLQQKELNLRKLTNELEKRVQTIEKFKQLKHESQKEQYDTNKLITTMKAENISNATRISQLEATNQNLTSHLQSVSTKNTAMEALNTSLMQKLKDTEDDSRTSKGTLESVVAQLQKENNDLREQNTEFEQEFSSLVLKDATEQETEHEVSTSSSAEEQQNYIKRLEQENTELQDQMAAFEQEYSSVKVQVENANATMAENESKNTSNMDKLRNKFDTEITELQKVIQQTSDNLETTKTKLKLSEALAQEQEALFTEHVTTIESLKSNTKLLEEQMIQNERVHQRQLADSQILNDQQAATLEKNDKTIQELEEKQTKMLSEQTNLLKESSSPNAETEVLFLKLEASVQEFEEKKKKLASEKVERQRLHEKRIKSLRDEISKLTDELDSRNSQYQQAQELNRKNSENFESNKAEQANLHEDYIKNLREQNSKTRLELDSAKYQLLQQSENFNLKEINLSNEIVKLTKRLNNSEADHRNNIQRLRDKNTQLLKQASRHAGELKKMRKAVYGETDEIQRQMVNLKIEYQSKIESLKQENEQLKSTVKKYSDELDVTGNLAHEHEMLQKRFSQLDDAHQKQEKSSETNNELQNLKDELSFITLKCNKQEMQIDDLETRLAKTTTSQAETIRIFEEEANKSNQTILSLNKNLDMAKSNSEEKNLKDGLAIIRLKCNKQEVKINKQEKKIDDLETQLAASVQTATSHVETIKRFEAEAIKSNQAILLLNKDLDLAKSSTTIEEPPPVQPISNLVNLEDREKSSLVTTVQNKHKQIEELETELLLKGSEISKREIERDYYSIRLSKLKDQFSALNEDYSKSKELCVTIKKEFDSALAENRTAVQQLKAQIKEKENSIEESCEEKSALQQSIVKLQDTNGDLLVIHRDLKSQLTVCTMAKDQLQEKVTFHDTKVAQLNAEIKLVSKSEWNIQREYSKLSTDHSKLQHENHNLLGAAKVHTDKINKLKNKVMTGNYKCEKIKRELDVQKKLFLDLQNIYKRLQHESELIRELEAKEKARVLEARKNAATQTKPDTSPEKKNAANQTKPDTSPKKRNSPTDIESSPTNKIQMDSTNNSQMDTESQLSTSPTSPKQILDVIAKDSAKVNDSIEMETQCQPVDSLVAKQPIFDDSQESEQQDSNSESEITEVQDSTERVTNDVNTDSEISDLKEHNDIPPLLSILDPNFCLTNLPAQAMSFIQQQKMIIDYQREIAKLKAALRRSTERLNELVDTYVQPLVVVLEKTRYEKTQYRELCLKLNTSLSKKSNTLDEIYRIFDIG